MRRYLPAYHFFGFLRVFVTTALLATLAGLAAPAPVAHAAVFDVDRLDDNAAASACTAAPNDCSLRGAITAANTNPGLDTINIPANVYTLAIAGAGENANATGDLDILAAGGDLIIAGAGAAGAIIDGGGIDRVFHLDPAGAGGITVSISGVTIRNGVAAGENGGGVYNNGDTLNLSDVIVTLNTSTVTVGGGTGGGVYNAAGGQVNISNCTFNQNAAVGGIFDAPAGGGLASYGNVSVTNSTFSNNTCANGFGGGGLYAVDGTVNVSGSTFTGNSGYEGGGIATRQDAGIPTLNVNNSTFSGNRATGDVGSGGGISSNGVLNITGSTFANNAATGVNSLGGGGLYHINDAAAIANSTFSGNSSITDGGGIYFRDVNMTLNYVTIASNTADSDNDGTGNGGGVFVENSGPAFNVGNTIIAQNSDLSGGGADCFTEDAATPLTSLDYNLIQDTTGCSIVGATANNITGVSPNVGPLQNNGGPTDTRALLPGSPAIDAANPASCLATDQRGVARPQPAGGRCDIGAYELVPSPEIEVFDGATGVPDNTGSVDFGSTTVGAPLARAFTVRNTGAADLHLTLPVTLPAGFSLVSSFGSLTLPPGGSTTFQVQLDAAAAGTFSGQLSFANDDADENPYNFTISGVVAPVPPPPSFPKGEDEDDDDDDDDAPAPPAPLSAPQAQEFNCWPWLVIVPPGAAPNAVPGTWCQAAVGQPLPMPGTFRYLQHSTEVTVKDAAGQPVTQFAAPLKICFRYTPAELALINNDPARFLIQVFRNGQWEALPTAPESGLLQPGVCALVDHLTLFALFAQADSPAANGSSPGGVKYLPETGEQPLSPWIRWAGRGIEIILLVMVMCGAVLRRRRSSQNPE
ncbi:MAG: choice-of-anchor D domain-containing protein [Anaerolineae bacterium]|nr:choice-of-anchor D domain-containing protein [Anaerolineae bacterium]